MKKSRYIESLVIKVTIIGSQVNNRRLDQGMR